MRTAVLIALLVAGSCVPAFAADPPKGPALADLMKQPANRAAWYGMFAGARPPQWVDDYAKTLDGPPTASVSYTSDTARTDEPIVATASRRKRARSPTLDPRPRKARVTCRPAGVG